MNAPRKASTANGSQRHLQDHQGDADDHRVDEGDDGRAANMTAEHVDRVFTNKQQASAVRLAHGSQEESPDPRPVFEEEIQDHDGEEYAGDDFDGKHRTADQPSPRLLTGEELDHSFATPL
jgi:hypothetical protein